MVDEEITVNTFKLEPGAYSQLPLGGSYLGTAYTARCSIGRPYNPSESAHVYSSCCAVGLHLDYPVHDWLYCLTCATKVITYTLGTIT